MRDMPSDFPDIRPESAGAGRQGFGRRKSFLKAVAAFAAATAGLTVLIAVPVLALELAAVDTVGIHGKTLSAAEFADRLENLFMGSLIVAASLVSFVASAALAAPKYGARVMEPDPSPDARHKPATPGASVFTKVHHV
ncbi:hypothetical protein GCM10009077_12420 [Roseibium denhamense]